MHTAILYYYNIYEQYKYNIYVYVCVLRGTHADRCCVHYNSGAGEKENNPSGKPSTFDYGNTTPPTNLPYIRVYTHIYIHTFFPLIASVRSCPRPSSCPRPRGTDREVFSRVCVVGGSTSSRARRTTCV